uniref:Protein kinase domain-containing protein n=1 Tax=Myripristis murdjan TaxID=586833 RepID=A0A667Y8B7_9TELE
MEPFASAFAFTREATLVCYAVKKDRSVLVLTTAHGPPHVDEGARQHKPLAVLAYNENKGGVDNLDKLVAAYSCRRATRRWPVALFHNVLDVSAYNALKSSCEAIMYITKGLIGQGAYGSVYRCKKIDSDDLYAMKVFDDFRESTIREMSIFHMLKGHDNIIELQDVSVHDEKVAAIMPLMSCTLGDVIFCRDPENTPLSFIARMSLQIANALQYMHLLGIVHRDLTPRNILLSDDMTVKVCDFGLSRCSLDKMSEGVVTCTHRAPELFQGSRYYKGEYYTSAIDVWSLGVIIVDAMEGCNLRKTLMPRVCKNEIVSRVVFDMFILLSSYVLSLVSSKSITVLTGSRVTRSGLDTSPADRLTVEQESPA